MNILKIIVITLIIVVSFLVAFLKPKMHKKIRIENADFDVVQFSEKKVEKKAAPFYAPKQVSAPKQEYQEPSSYNPSPQEESPKAQPIAAPKPAQTQQQTLPPNAPPKTPPQVPQQPTAPITPPTTPEKKVLTEEQQEIIAWNKWRSDLQNQVMRDSKIIAPVGTKFEFSFTVDKFGNISNLRVWTEPSYYTQMAMKKIRPILLGYQGQPILNFPPQSKRVIVNIEGRFFMARTAKFSSPSDYSDYERVK